MKPKNPISESGANLGFDSVVGDAIDAMGMECPEHALKIYKSNQDFKFLLVHPVRNFSYHIIFFYEKFLFYFIIFLFYFILGNKCQECGNASITRIWNYRTKFKLFPL